MSRIKYVSFIFEYFDILKFISSSHIITFGYAFFLLWLKQLFLPFTRLLFSFRIKKCLNLAGIIVKKLC